MGAALEAGATNLRIIIPCNTLYAVAKQLQRVFSNRLAYAIFTEDNRIFGPSREKLCTYLDTVTVEAPAVAEIVVDEVNSPDVSRILVSASKAAGKAYKKVVEKEYDDLEMDTWLPEEVDDFQELLVKSLSGHSFAESASETEDDEVIVSGCTDVKLDYAEDSTEIFAGRLVEDAYRKLNIIKTSEEVDSNRICDER
jgi:hypothetical protein